MMLRPVLLATLVVCSLGASVVAVGPVAADGGLDSPLPDGSDDGDRDSTGDGTSDDSGGAESTPDDERDESDEEDEERWYDSWESDRENRSDDRTADGDDDGGTNETTDDGANSSSDDDDGDGTDGRDGYGDADGHDDENESARDADRENRSQVTEGVLSDEAVEWVKERVSGAATDVYRGPGSDTLSDDVPNLGDGDRPNAREDRSAAAPTEVDDRGDRTHDRTAATAESDDSTEAVSAAQTTSESSDPDDDGGSADGDRDGSEVPEPPSGAGAGVALFVTVGYLGGTRTAVTQANLLATTAPGDTLRSLRPVARERLGRLPHVLPAVFGYSRHDDSDPLENDTRAAIYDQVRESPGIYHARLAEETDVAVETVRYHCRILDEEGLVERRKHRGKQRLYPVSVDGGDPELGAALADSAAADVLAAVERLEPATLSAVAEHVGCAPSTVTYHIDRLEEDGLVTRERDGGAVQVRLRRDARSALQTSVADD